MNNEQSRRSFFATLALGVSASAFPMMLNEFDELENFNNFTPTSAADAEKWFENIKGRHRIAYDGS